MLKLHIKVTQKKEKSKEMLKKIDNGLNDIADFIFERSQDMVPVDEGTLKKSGYVEREFLKKEIGYDTSSEYSMASYVAGFTSGVGTTFNYALAIEYGTRPHFPPVAPLAAWAIRVLGIDKKEAQQIGFLIARKIAAEGTEPQPYLRPAADEGKIKAPGIMKKAIQ